MYSGSWCHRYFRRGVPPAGRGRFDVTADRPARDVSHPVVQGPVGADPAGQHVERLREVLAGRSMIAQANGVIMARYQVSAAAASRILRDLSRRRGRPLRQVAGDVLLSSQIRLAAPADAQPCGGDPTQGAAAHPAAGEPPASALTSRPRPSPLGSEVSPLQPDGTIYIRAAGDWTRATGGEIRDMLDQVGDRCPTLVILDLADVGVLDGAGLGALLAVHRELAVAECVLELQNPPPRIKRLLRVTKLRCIPHAQ